jgi:hypothetical protein
LQNTGANCPDTASGCPANVTLTDLGTDEITSPGLYENFFVNGKLQIKASNVTLRNFEINCSNNTQGIDNNQQYTNIVIEYGTVQKGTTPCKDGIWTTATNMKILHVHLDQHESDGFNGSGSAGPILIERSLVTRPGDNGGYGSPNHSDVWQQYSTVGSQEYCWFGSRVVPSYCPFLYKSGVVTQSGVDPGFMWIYNNWLDGSASTMISGDNKILRNNKFGNFASFDSGSGYWGGNTVDNGGNVFECDGSPLTQANREGPSVQMTCPWGFDNTANNPTGGWDGFKEVDWFDHEAPADVNGDSMFCTGTVDSQPIDPTEFCTSDGSGCIVTPAP